MFCPDPTLCLSASQAQTTNNQVQQVQQQNPQLLPSPVPRIPNQTEDQQLDQRSVIPQPQSNPLSNQKLLLNQNPVSDEVQGYHRPGQVQNRDILLELGGIGPTTHVPASQQKLSGRHSSMAFLASLLPQLATSLISTLAGTAVSKIIGDAPLEDDIVQLVEHGLESNLGQKILASPEAAAVWENKFPEWQRQVAGKLTLVPMNVGQSTISSEAGRSGNNMLQTHQLPQVLESPNPQPMVTEQQPSAFQQAMEPQPQPIQSHQQVQQQLTTSRQTLPSTSRLPLSQSQPGLQYAQQSVIPQSQMLMPQNNQIMDSRTLTPTVSENAVRYAANVRAAEAIQGNTNSDMMHENQRTNEAGRSGILSELKQHAIDTAKEGALTVGKAAINEVGSSLLNTLTGRMTRSERLRANRPYNVRSPGRVEITEVFDEHTPAITQSHLPAIMPGGIIDREPQTINNQGSQVLFNRPYSFERNRNMNVQLYRPSSSNGETARKMSISRSLTDALKDTAKSAMTTTLSSAANFALRKIIGDSPTGSVKVVGDAPIPTGSVLLENDPNVRKVVGDAPGPSATLGDDNAKSMDRSTAAGADKATLTRYISMIQLLEQTLTIDSSSNWNSYAEYIRSLASNFRRVLAEYDRTSISLETQFWGSAFLPTLYNTGDYDAPPLDLHGARYDYYAWNWRVETVWASSSPPVLATTDMSSLLTATRGGVITEFSSAMRLNLSVFSSESMAYLVHLIADMTINSNGYSFCEPLLKLLMNLQSLYPIPGTEASEWQYGIHWREIVPHQRADFWARAFMFPCHHVDIGNIPLAVVSYEQFVLHAASKSTILWADEWSVMTWGIDTAVIFLKNEDRNDPIRFFVKVLSVTEYPFYSYAMNMDVNLLLNPEGWMDWEHASRAGHHLVENRPAEYACIPVCNAVYIPGPSARILVVMLDQKSMQGNDFCFSVASRVGDALPAPAPIAYADYGPTNYRIHRVMGTSHPFRDRNRVDSFFDPWDCHQNYVHRDIVSAAIQREIANWERDFGNTSDRSQAMRITANFAQAFGPNKVFNRARPNTQDPVRKSMHIVQAGLPASHVLGWPVFYDVAFVDTATTTANNTAALTLTTDGCGLFPLLRRVGGTTVPPLIEWNDACNLDTIAPYVHYTVGRRNAMMELAVLKNLVTVAEELPGNLLSTSVMVDVAVMRMMGQLISQTSDFIKQELSIDWYVNVLDVAAERLVVAQDVNHIGVVSNLLNMSLKRAIDWILSFGIQFPSTQCEVWSSCDVADRRAAVRRIYDGLNIPYVPICRIPIWAHKNASRLFDLTTPIINFTDGLIGRGLTHYCIANDGTYPPAPNMQLFDDMQTRSPVSDAVTISGVRLTMSEVPELLSNNPVVFLTATERKNYANKMGYPFVGPDVALANSFALSSYNENIVIDIGHNFRALPMGYLLPTVFYCWSDICCLSLYCAADKDVYMGGSSNWKVFTIPESHSDTLVSALPDLPEFQTFGDIKSLFSY